MAASLSRARALWLIAFIWALIYLPALGTLEIKGEEGRRLLPGITMLESGNWIVPSVGGVDYFSKPPLINWATAAAVGLSGRQNEWAARAPSALCVLALSAGTIWLLTDWLGGAGALVAAIFMLTGIGMMEKGRLAEIEAMYISLSGLAIVSWLGLWRQTCLETDRTRTGRSARWLAWTVPWVFLGFGLLAKGPAHLLFFYGMVVGILLAARRTRDLWRWPHLAGVILMLVIFAAWAVPYLHLTAAERAGRNWSNQLTSRLEVDDSFRPGMWALNIPRGLVNFVPWVVLLPLLWRRPTIAPAGPAVLLDAAILRGGRLALTACFLLVSLAPGSLPRYTLPLLVPASVLLALVCTRDGVSGALPKWLPIVWGRTLIFLLILAAIGSGVAAKLSGGGWHWLAAAGLTAVCAWLVAAGPMRSPDRHAIPRLAVFSATLMAVLTLTYATFAVPRLLSKERLRPLAEHLNLTFGQAAPLYAYQPGFLPIFFYLHPSAKYIRQIESLPATASYLLVFEKDKPLVERQLRAGGFQVQQVIQLDHLSRGTWFVLCLKHAAQ